MVPTQPTHALDRFARATGWDGGTIAGFVRRHLNCPHRPVALATIGPRAHDAFKTIQQSQAGWVFNLDEHLEMTQWLVEAAEGFRSRHHTDGDAKDFFLGRNPPTARSSNPLAGQLGDHPLAAFLACEFRSAVVAPEVVNWAFSWCAARALAFHELALGMTNEERVATKLESGSRTYDALRLAFESSDRVFECLYTTLGGREPSRNLSASTITTDIAAIREIERTAITGAGRALQTGLVKILENLRLLLILTLKRPSSRPSTVYYETVAPFGDWPTGRAEEEIALKVAPSTGDDEPLILSQDIAPDELLPTVARQKLDAKLSWEGYRTSVETTLLSWAAFNEVERSAVESKLTSDKEGGDSEATDMLGVLTLGTTKRSGIASEPCQPGARVFEVQLPADAFKPSEMEQGLYRPTSRTLLIQSDLLKDRETIPNGIDRIISHSLVSSLSKDPRYRVSRRRVLDDIHHRISNLGGDRVFAMRLREGRFQPFSGSPYYVWHDERALKGLLARCDLDVQLEHGRGIGSAGVPRITAVKECVMSLRDEIAQHRRTNNFRRLKYFHNLYVSYHALFGYTASGGREVSDPFHSPNTILGGRRIGILCDKVTDAAHGARVVPLAEAFIQQDEYYRVHLDVLRLKLQSDWPELASAIRSLLHGSSLPAGIPYLFFLTDQGIESVSPSSLRRQIGERWPFHDSALRHLFATDLRALGCSPELVEILLGHWPSHATPFGASSAMAFPEVAEATRPHLDALLKRCGFAAIKGLSMPKNKTLLTVTPPAPLKHQPNIDIGPHRRKKDSEIARLADRNAVRQAVRKILELFKCEPSEAVPDVLIEEAQQEIIDLDGPRKAYRLTLLSRYLRHLRARGAKLTVTGMPGRGQIVPSPVQDVDGTTLQIVDVLRENFQEWLDEKFPKAMSSAKRSASDKAKIVAGAILASAILFGGLSRKKRKHFVSGLRQGRIFHFRGLYWIEVDEPVVERRRKRKVADETSDSSEMPDGAKEESEYENVVVDEITHRFVANSMTRLIMIYVLNNQELLNAIQGIRSYELIRKAAEAILNHGASRFRKFRQAPVTIPELTTWVTNDLATRLPGAVAAYLRDEIECRSLPRDSFIRVISGESLALDDAWEASGDDVHPRPAAKFRSGPLADEIEKFRELRAVIEDSEGSSAKVAVKAVKDLTKECEGDGCYPIVWYLARYAQRLLLHGGERKLNLRAGTVLSYVRLNGDAVIRAVGAADIAALDADERHGIYSDLLDSKIAQPAIWTEQPEEDEDDGLSGPRGASKRGHATLLKLFDKFLVRDYGAEPMDWRLLDPAMKPSLTDIHANCVSTADLSRADQFFNALPARDPRLAEHLCLVEMGRLAFRNGEAERFGFGDYLGDTAYVRTKGGHSPKTRAGTRQVPILGSDSEFLSPVLDRCRKALSIPEPDLKNLPIVSAGGFALDRHVWTKQIKRALVLATGDPGIRVYDLRHGSIQQKFLLALDLRHPVIARLAGFKILSEYIEASQELRERLCGENFSATPQYLLQALATSFGHTDIRISLRHYVHLLDVVAACAADLATPEPSTGTIAFLTGRSASRIRGLRSELRTGGREPELYDLLLALDQADRDIPDARFPELGENKVVRSNAEPRSRVLALPYKEFVFLSLRILAGESVLDLADVFWVDEQDGIELRDVLNEQLVVTDFDPRVPSSERVRKRFERLWDEFGSSHFDPLLDAATEDWMVPVLDALPDVLTPGHEPLRFRSRALMNYFEAAAKIAGGQIKPPTREELAAQLQREVRTSTNYSHKGRDRFELMIGPAGSTRPSERNDVPGHRNFKQILWLARARRSLAVRLNGRQEEPESRDPENR